ncbi:MAG: hypothetical protein KGI38_03780 [Thaumarchaeota archaeon]|nr:hypothetical protein [Nitrososphaerota archaeon]
MIPYLVAFVSFLGATLIPVLLGLGLVTTAGRRIRREYLAALAVGIFLWYFSDTVGDSAYLDVNASFSGGIEHVALFALFAVGLLLVFALDTHAFSPETEAPAYSLAIPILMAFAIGIHGLGEGADTGATAALTQSTSVLDAFGGLSPGVGYVIHKALEPMMVGVSYCIYSKGRLTDMRRVLRDVFTLAAVFTVPAVIGEAFAYSVPFDTTYAFAFATGTSFYAVVRLSKPLFNSHLSESESFRAALFLLLGLGSIYFAALFH